MKTVNVVPSSAVEVIDTLPLRDLHWGEAADEIIKQL
jgi:hypothetical protein